MARQHERPILHHLWQLLQYKMQNFPICQNLTHTCNVGIVSVFCFFFCDSSPSPRRRTDCETSRAIFTFFLLDARNNSFARVSQGHGSNVTRQLLQGCWTGRRRTVASARIAHTLGRGMFQNEIRTESRHRAVGCIRYAKMIQRVGSDSQEALKDLR